MKKLYTLLLPAICVLNYCTAQNSFLGYITGKGLPCIIFEKYKSTAAPLTVSLINFSCKAQGRDNMLQWSTTSEQDDSGFEVQRATLATYFTKVGFVKTKTIEGYSNQKLDYSFADFTFPKGTNYYRLKQIDKNGKYTYSNTISVKDGNTVAQDAIEMHPNPVKDVLNIVPGALAAGKINIQVTGMQGKVVINKVVESPGKAGVQLNVLQLTPGTYFIKLIAADGSEKAVEKFIKQ